jgi:hypothetical protein
MIRSVYGLASQHSHRSPASNPFYLAAQADLQRLQASCPITSPMPANLAIRIYSESASYSTTTHSVRSTVCEANRIRWCGTVGSSVRIFIESFMASRLVIVHAEPVRSFSAEPCSAVLQFGSNRSAGVRISCRSRLWSRPSRDR